ncbi:hypothetical protein GCM10009577_53840 [Streptomyces javensis]
MADLAPVVNDGFGQRIDDVGDLAQRIATQRTALARAREEPVPVADDPGGGRLLVRRQCADRGQRRRPQRLVQPHGARRPPGRVGLQDVVHELPLFLVGVVGDDLLHPVPDVRGGRGLTVDGEVADQPLPQVMGEELKEVRHLVGVPADHEHIEGPPPEQLLELADELPEVAFAQLIGLVADPVLGEPRGVVGLAQRTVPDFLQLPGLVEVVLPDLAGPPVHDDGAGTVVLVQHGQHGADVRIGVHHDALAGGAWQPHLLVHVLAATGEDGDGAGPVRLEGQRLLQLHDVLAEREPRGMIERAVQ